jgi:hypothetical protein
MSTNAYPPSGTASHVTGATSVDNYIPELWADEIIAGFKSNLVLANLVSTIPHTGKKGDTIHIPNPTRDDANEKSEATGVTVISNVEGNKDVAIDQHWEYSRLIEDFANVQANPVFRGFYTDDAGYALAQRVDRELWMETTLLNGGASPAAATLFETGYIGGDGSTLYANTTPGNGTTLTDAGIRTLIQRLDDADVPMSERSIVIPPVEKKTLTGIPRFTEQAFVGEGGAGNTIRNGYVGELYGAIVYVTTNCPYIHVNDQTSTASVNFSSTDLAEGSAAYVDEYGLTVDWTTGTVTSDIFRACLLLHKSALVHIPQMGVRTQTQYKQEYLADLFTADVIFGTGELRDDAGVVFVVPN